MRGLGQVIQEAVISRRFKMSGRTVKEEKGARQGKWSVFYRARRVGTPLRSGG